MDNIQREKLNKIILLAKDIKCETDDKVCHLLSDQIVAIVESLVIKLNLEDLEKKDKSNE
jgi:hypothetical protein